MATALLAVSRLQQAAGELDGAVVSAARAVRLRESLLGSDSAGTAEAAAAHGQGLLLTGNVEAGLEAVRSAVATLERLSGPSDIRVLSFRMTLARAYQMAGRDGSALAELERCAADCESAHGPVHPLTADARFSLAIFARQTRPVPSASDIAASRAAVAMSEVTFGKDHRRTVALDAILGMHLVLWGGMASLAEGVRLVQDAVKTMAEDP